MPRRRWRPAGCASSNSAGRTVDAFGTRALDLGPAPATAGDGLALRAERPRTTPRAGVRAAERRRLLGIRALSRRPPVGRRFVGECGDRGFDAHRVFAGILTVDRRQWIA